MKPFSRQTVLFFLYYSLSCIRLSRLCRQMQLDLHVILFNIRFATVKVRGNVLYATAASCCILV